MGGAVFVRTLEEKRQQRTNRREATECWGPSHHREQVRDFRFFLGSPDVGMEGKVLQLYGNPCKEKGRAVFILRNV